MSDPQHHDDPLVVAAGLVRAIMVLHPTPFTATGDLALALRDTLEWAVEERIALKDDRARLRHQVDRARQVLMPLDT